VLLIGTGSWCPKGVHIVIDFEKLGSVSRFRRFP